MIPYPGILIMNHIRLLLSDCTAECGVTILGTSHCKHTMLSSYTIFVSPIIFLLQVNLRRSQKTWNFQV